MPSLTPEEIDEIARKKLSLRQYQVWIRKAQGLTAKRIADEITELGGYGSRDPDSVPVITVEREWRRIRDIMGSVRDIQQEGYVRIGVDIAQGSEVRFAEDETLALVAKRNRGGIYQRFG